MTRRSTLVLLLLALAILAVAMVPKQIRRYREHQEEQRLREEERRKEVEYKGPDLEVIGDPQAPLKAIWAVPVRHFTKEGVQDINEVKEWVGQHSKLVNLTIARMGAADAKAVLEANNVTCAGVSIGGYSRFQLWDRGLGHWRRQSLEMAPGVTYRSWDVIDVFEQYLENQGHLPRNRTLGQPGTGTKYQ